MDSCPSQQQLSKEDSQPKNHGVPTVGGRTYFLSPKTGKSFWLSVFWAFIILVSCALAVFGNAGSALVVFEKWFESIIIAMICSILAAIAPFFLNLGKAGNIHLAITDWFIPDATDKIIFPPRINKSQGYCRCNITFWVVLGFLMMVSVVNGYISWKSNREKFGLSQGLAIFIAVVCYVYSNVTKNQALQKFWTSCCQRKKLPQDKKEETPLISDLESPVLTNHKPVVNRGKEILFEKSGSSGSKEQVLTLLRLLELDPTNWPVGNPPAQGLLVIGGD